MMTSFRYLGKVISAADEDWPLVFRNLAKAWAVWQRMTRIIIKEGDEPRVSIDPASWPCYMKSCQDTALLYAAATSTFMATSRTPFISFAVTITVSTAPLH